MQDISLEKFGLHNFLERLDLSLFQFKDTELEGKIQALRGLTYEDYQQMKVNLEEFNQEFKGGLQFNTATPTDEKEGSDFQWIRQSNFPNLHYQGKNGWSSTRRCLRFGSSKAGTTTNFLAMNRSVETTDKPKQFIDIKQNKTQFQVKIEKNQSILDAALDQKIPLDYKCKKGLAVNA